MRRRGIGLGRTGIIGGSNNKRKPINDRFKALGKKIEDQHIDHIQEQMSLFKSKLEEFANKHTTFNTRRPNISYAVSTNVFQNRC